MDTTQIAGVVPVYPSIDQKAHDLTILYLKHQNIKDLSATELTNKYKDVSNEIKELLK